jgi:hypothetical protein
MAEASAAMFACRTNVDHAVAHRAARRKDRDAKAMFESVALAETIL